MVPPTPQPGRPPPIDPIEYETTMTRQTDWLPRAGRIAQPEDFGANLAERADTKGMSVVRSIADEIRLFGASIAPELDVSAAYELRT